MSRSTASIQMFPIPLKAAGARPDDWCALPMQQSCSVCSVSSSSISARPSSYLSGPGTVTSPRHVVSLPYTVQVSQMNLVPGATVKAGEEIAEVISPEQDSIVATYMRALADIAGRTAELRIKARVAQESLEAVALLSARDRGSGGTHRRHGHGHCDLPHGSLARARLGPQSRRLAGGGSRRVRRSTCLPG